MNLPAGRSQTAMFTASEVEAQTGVPATTLRQWERRYGFPRPERSANGYRLYSPHDVAAIQRMQAHLNAGVPASRAAELTQRDLDAVPDEPEARDAAEWSRQLTQALIGSDMDQAGAVLGQVHAQLPVEDVLTHVISPTLADIGARWERGEITVAHEHQASAFLRARLSHLMDVAGVQEGFGPLVVAACAPGEEHELGLMMLTLALRRRGVRVAYLGANVPLGDLAVFTRQQGARAVLLALNGDWALGPTREHLRDLDGLGVPLFVGGALLNARPDLAAELGGTYAGPDAPRAAQLIAAHLHRNEGGST
ncbi:MerR family transcriptional regulator [Deinococcus soli (ex Cha et al. 2016)]|uniref:MerR family transcriptional regulator n=1 Tax=Deinococcus soli (ex Cha et al. 2016) TaxID=1309411 RepID=A0A0F7JJ83_9DEIO|nr:MerR family transcriptional regulator [Deinococcus soli (ex Cha et al. 2016)]AKH16126.1 MerR family transcriptional regulator [Deinococcus soli (ex Cha et al. 2016)]